MNNKYNVGDVVTRDTSGQSLKIMAVAEDKHGEVDYALQYEAGERILVVSCREAEFKLIKAAPPSYELGEEVEVKTCGRWYKRIFLWEKNNTICTVDDGQEEEFEAGGRPRIHTGWLHIRKINTEPTIKITCIVNDKPVPLSALSMETIEAIREGEKS